MKLIDKNELLEELKKLKQNLSASPIVVIEDVKSLVESLEVKDVDLNSEITLWANAIPEIRLDDVERLAIYFFELGLKAQSKDMIEALRTEYEKGRHDVIEKTLKWLWDLNDEHEIMSYTDSHVLDSDELQKYYKNNIE